MAFNLGTGRYLTCFYCGKRSSKKLWGKVPSWECSFCESVNYLDEHGRITDPPATSTSNAPAPAPIRYAQAEPATHTLTNTSNSIFCGVCLKNQHIIRENLAHYLPAESDPRYRQFVATQDKYKADLERRYPPVCSNCAPKVRERIKRAAYVARTDHLRRMMERTRVGAKNLTKDRNWRRFIFRVAGMCWWSGALGQVCWHAVETLALYGRRVAAFEEIQFASSSYSSSLKSYLDRNQGDLQQARQLLLRFMPLFVSASTATVWWNNRMQTKYLGAGGRMVNLGQYYMLQLVSLGWRAVAWLLVLPVAKEDYSAMVYDNKLEKMLGLHVFMTCFTLLILLILAAIVRLDTQPLVSFHITDEMILPEIPDGESVEIKPSRSAQPAPFPIKRLNENALTAKLPAGPQPLSTESVALINQQYDADAMDWVPTSPLQLSPSYNFRPRAQHTVLNPNPPPIVGQTLPNSRGSFPITGTQNVSSAISPFPRNAGIQLQQSRDSFRRRAPSTTTIMTEATSEDAGNSDDESIASHVNATPRPGGKQKHFKFANPRFFPAQDQVDTGLETMFDQAFSIEDEHQAGQYRDNTALADAPARPSMFDWRPPVNEHAEHSSTSIWVWSLCIVIPFVLISGGALALTNFIHNPESRLYGIGSTISRPDWIRSTSNE